MFNNMVVEIVALVALVPAYRVANLVMSGRTVWETGGGDCATPSAQSPTLQWPEAKYAEQQSGASMPLGKGSYMNILQRASAEALGTFWLVFGGCGSAVLSAAFPDVGIGLLGVSLAFGLTVLTMAYSIGHISGCHLNPAVTIGLAAGGRFAAKDIPAYVIAQLVGAVLAAAALYIIASGAGDVSGLASNGFGEHSPGGFSMIAGLLAEILLTAFFLIIILGATDGRAPAGFAPIAIGLGLTLIHLISIPVTNTSVNPARSTGPALIEGGIALQQLWLFWVAPIAGAVLGAVVYRFIGKDPASQPDIAGDAA